MTVFPSGLRETYYDAAAHHGILSRGDQISKGRVNKKRDIGHYSFSCACAIFSQWGTSIGPLCIYNCIRANTKLRLVFFLW